jgi:hypothetical protein
MINKTLCPSWNPYQTFTWTLKELQVWYDKFRSSAFYDGKLWTPKSKRLCLGRYSVKFIKEN